MNAVAARQDDSPASLNQNAILNTGPEDINAVSSTVRGFDAQVRNISGLQNALAHDLPPWPTLQNAAANINTSLSTLQQPLNDEKRSAIYQRIHPHPLPNLHVAQHHGAFDILLRKKLQPDVEDWMTERMRVAAEFCHIPTDLGDFSGGRRRDDVSKDDVQLQDADDQDESFNVQRMQGTLNGDDMESVWADALGWAAKTLRLEQLGKLDKLNEESDEGEEIEEGEEEEEEEEDDEDEEMEDEPNNADEQPELQGPQLPLGSIMKFMSTGVMDVPAAAQPRAIT